MKQGWTHKTLRDIADIKGGKRVPKGYKLQTTETNHPYIRVADFNDFGTVDMSDIQYISDDIFEQIKNYTITDKDLYVSIAGTIGKTGIIPSLLNGANLTENACKLVFKEDINLRFVYLFTLSEIFKKQVVKATKQASQPKLALTRLAEFKISIPPLAEQERIVERLDAAFAQIDELKSNAEKQLAEARALFQSALTQAMQPKPGWQEKTLPDISENLDSIRVPITKKNRTTGIYPYYGASGIVDYVDDYLFDEDLLCISEDGANLLMRTYPIAFPIFGKAWVNNHAHVLRFKNLYTQKYVEYYFESIKLDEFITGAAQPKLTQKALNSIIIPLPLSLDEQKSIIYYLNSLSSRIIELEEISRKTAAECDAMKQALLRQIFE